MRDLHDDEDLVAWAGLVVVVDEPVKSRFRVEYASSGLLRISHDDRPLLWCRWHGGFDGFSWLRATEVPHLLPPGSSHPRCRLKGRTRLAVHSST